MNGCTVNTLMSLPSSSPETVQVCVSSAPMVQWPGDVRMTAAGPIPQSPVRADALDAVGNEKSGPKPQTTRPECSGVKNTCSVMSPTPVSRLLSAAGALTNGTSVRQTSMLPRPITVGSTGFNVNVLRDCPPSAIPLTNSNSRGTLISLATGFWVCFAKSESPPPDWAAVMTGAAQSSSAAHLTRANITARLIHP